MASLMRYGYMQSCILCGWHFEKRIEHAAGSYQCRQEKVHRYVIIDDHYRRRHLYHHYYHHHPCFLLHCQCPPYSGSPVTEWRCPSACLSVCLSVQFRPISQECKLVQTSNFGGNIPSHACNWHQKVKVTRVRWIFESTTHCPQQRWVFQ